MFVANLIERQNEKFKFLSINFLYFAKIMRYLNYACQVINSTKKFKYLYVDRII